MLTKTKAKKLSYLCWSQAVERFFKAKCS